MTSTLETSACDKTKRRRRVSAISAALRELGPDRECTRQPSCRFGPKGVYSLRVANSLVLREKAWRLAYRVYLRKGFVRPDPSGMRVMLHDALPGATTFLIENTDREVPVATVTVLPDSPMGLPMDGDCGAELDALRAAGRRPCEFTRLVLDETELRIDGNASLATETLLRLFSAAHLTAKEVLNATDIVACTAPRHARYYQSKLLFSLIGEPRSIDSVQGAPGVPLCLDLNGTSTRYQERYGHRAGLRNLFSFFTGGTEALLEMIRRQSRPFSEEELRYFFVEKTTLLERADSDQRRYLQECYLAYDFDGLFLTADLSLLDTAIATGGGR